MAGKVITTTHPHMGEIVKKVMSDNKIVAVSVAESIGVPYSGVARYKQQHTLQGRILWKLGLVMEHNFFADLSALFPIKAASAEELALTKIIQEKDQRITDLEKELAIYKEIVLKR
jgi:hypothetical protein